MANLPPHDPNVLDYASIKAQPADHRIRNYVIGWCVAVAILAMWGIFAWYLSQLNWFNWGI